jgi:hypothetical protein
MVDSAFQTQYRNEHIAAFEQNYSLLRACCVREAVIKGNTAVFLVSGSGGATAVTRGVNGYIPYGTVENVQNSCVLQEYHAPFERTGFNIFASQGDQRRIMQLASVAVLNRNIDQLIINQLDTATLVTGTTGQKATLNMIVKARTILGNNEVPLWEEENIFGVISPAFEGYLMQVTEFSSADYVEIKPFVGPAKQMRRWMGVNWMVHPNLTGVGTSSEKCYMFHRNAIGHAANSKEMAVEVDYDRKQDLSWSRASLFHNAKLLQGALGVVQMLHDGSEYVSG